MTQKSKVVLKAKPKKVIAKTRNEMAIINKKYLGEEPSFGKIVPLTRIEIANALNWYNYMRDTEDAKEYAVSYLRNIKRDDLAKIILKTSDDNMIRSIGWIGRIIENGYSLPDEYASSLIEKVKSLENLIKKEEKPVTIVTTQVVSIYSKYQHMLDDEIDKIAFSDKADEKFSFYDWATANQLSRNAVASLRGNLETMLEYYSLILSGKDEQLSEGYAKKSRIWKKNMVSFYTTMISDIDRLLDNAKKQRKPRAKKTPSKDKLLKFFKIQESSPEHKVQSIPAIKVLGASELWYFNTKYKTLHVLRAKTETGFSVDRMTITNVDENKSFSKNIGKKADVILASILNGTKAYVKKSFEAINRTQSEANPRSSEHMIILRVF